PRQGGREVRRGVTGPGTARWRRLRKIFLAVTSLCAPLAEGKALSNSLPVRSIARDFQGSVRTWGQSDGLRGRGVNCYRVLPPRHPPSASGAAPRPGSRAGRAECPPALAHPRRHSCPDTTAAISAD